MGLNIKNPATEAAIRALATTRGVGLTEAVNQAVREALEREAAARATMIEEKKRKINEIVERVAARTDVDPRSWREIEAEMYDENGLPT